MNLLLSREIHTSGASLERAWLQWTRWSLKSLQLEPFYDYMYLVKYISKPCKRRESCFFLIANFICLQISIVRQSKSGLIIYLWSYHLLRIGIYSVVSRGLVFRDKTDPPCHRGKLIGKDLLKSLNNYLIHLPDACSSSVKVQQYLGVGSYFEGLGERRFENHAKVLLQFMSNFWSVGGVR